MRQELIFILRLPDQQNPDSSGRRVLHRPIAGPSRISHAVPDDNLKRDQAEKTTNLSVFDPCIAALAVSIETRIKILPAHRFRSVAFPAEILNERIWIKRAQRLEARRHIPELILGT